MLNTDTSNPQISFTPQLDLFLFSYTETNLFSLDRRAIRRQSFPVRSKIDLCGELRRGKGKNISPLGLSFLIENPTHVQTSHLIQIGLINQSFVFWITGAVRAIQEFEGTHFEPTACPIMELAVEFIDMSAKEKTVLASLIEGYHDRLVSLTLEVRMVKIHSVQPPIPTTSILISSESPLLSPSVFSHSTGSEEHSIDQLHLPIHL